MQPGNDRTIARIYLAAADLFWCLPMLLTSPGDNGSSPSMDFLLDQPGDASKGQSGIEGDRVTSVTALDPLGGKQAQLENTDHLALTSVSPGVNASETPSDVSTAGASPLTSRSHKNARLKSPLQDKALDGLYALRQAGERKTPQLRPSLLGAGTLARLIESNPVETSDLGSFAEPLSPLRERDFKALSDFFLRDDIYAIEADVKQRLLSLLPEPCWEENVFDFLQEFLQTDQPSSTL
jgi:hypothetical protein